MEAKEIENILSFNEFEYFPPTNEYLRNVDGKEQSVFIHYDLRKIYLITDRGNPSSTIDFPKSKNDFISICGQNEIRLIPLT